MIKMEYLLTEGTEAAEGTTVIECEKCHRKFAVPAGAGLMAGTICEECSNLAAAEAAAELKNEKSDEVKAAIGD